MHHRGRGWPDLDGQLHDQGGRDLGHAKRADHWAPGVGTRHVRLETDGLGHWQVDGEAASHLDGCLYVNLESSAITNALPVHRLDLDAGARAPAAAAYVRALDFSAGRLDQDYLRCADEGRHQRYDYAAPVFDFACRLVYDESGLVLDYPGIAVRAF